MFSRLLLLTLLAATSCTPIARRMIEIEQRQPPAKFRTQLIRIMNDSIIVKHPSRWDIDDTIHWSNIASVRLLDPARDLTLACSGAGGCCLGAIIAGSIGAATATSGNSLSKGLAYGGAGAAIGLGTGYGLACLLTHERIIQINSRADLELLRPYELLRQ